MLLKFDNEINQSMLKNFDFNQRIFIKESGYKNTLKYFLIVDKSMISLISENYDKSIEIIDVSRKLADDLLDSI
jgi:hypothetical protein